MAYPMNNTVTCVTPARKPATLLGRIRQMLAIRRQRVQLRDLDDHMLDDIGVTRAEAEKESRTAAWNVPTYWRG